MIENRSKFASVQLASPVDADLDNGSTSSDREGKPRGFHLREATDTSVGRMGHLRLLIALDALLVEGSVGKAAERLGIGTPAMSRLLAQIREFYGDPILVRTGRGMVPTTLAEQLRVRLRALATEAEALLKVSTGGPAENSAVPHVTQSASRKPLLKAPPLAMRQTVTLEGQPSPEHLARRLDEIAADAEPQRRMAKHIATVGGGPGRSRPLTMEESDEAMSIILNGHADPTQIGALLIAMQYRGVVAPELAGLVRAARRQALARPLAAGIADLDWPAYLSPRRGSAPWFVLSAKLLAQSGRRVVLHGFEQEEGYLGSALDYLGISICRSPSEAQSRLEAERIAFLPLGSISPQLQALVGLYSLFEMRSPLNLLVHLLNPQGARASILGVPAPSSGKVQQDAAALLGWQDLAIVSTSRDVAQINPFHATPLICLKSGKPERTTIGSIPKQKPQARSGLSTMEYLKAVWEGAARDEHATGIVISTAAAGLLSLHGASWQWPEAYSEARRLWVDRC